MDTVRPPLIYLLFVFAGLSFSPSSHAYLDPGTGSLILQGVIAAIATAGFTAKIYWQRIKTLFKRDQSEEAESPDDSGDEKPQ